MSSGRASEERLFCNESRQTMTGSQMLVFTILLSLPPLLVTGQAGGGTKVGRSDGIWNS